MVLQDFGPGVGPGQVSKREKTLQRAHLSRLKPEPVVQQAAYQTDWDRILIYGFLIGNWKSFVIAMSQHNHKVCI